MPCINVKFSVFAICKIYVLFCKIYSFSSLHQMNYIISKKKYFKIYIYQELVKDTTTLIYATLYCQAKHLVMALSILHFILLEIYIGI